MPQLARRSVRPRRSCGRSRATGLSRRGAADGHLAHEHGGLARRHRHTLALLAAHPGPGLEVVADRVDHAQHLGPVADELRGPYRSGDLAALDEVRLGDPEHEVAGRGVDLAPAELDAVDAVVDAA